MSLNNAEKGHLVYFVVGIQLYQDLALQLGNQARCFGTFLPAEELLVSGVKNDKWHVSDLAAAYRDVIVKHSQGESISLIGVSFGGVVAYELARQLTEEGVNVSLVVMLDSLLPSGIKRNFLKRIGSKIKKIGKLNPGHSLKRIQIKLLRNNRNQKFHQKIKTAEELSEQRLVVYADAVNRFEKTDSSRSYNGKTLLIHAQETIEGKENIINNDYGWKKHLTGNFIIDSAPGDHLGILKPPYVDVTADIIKRALSDAIAKT